MRGNTQHAKRRVTTVLAALAAGFMVLLGLPSAAGHSAGNSDEHGMASLSFEATEEGCLVSFKARNVDAAEATLIVQRPGAGPFMVTEHEEELDGEPEEGDGFRYEAGPLDLRNRSYQFTLEWGEQFAGHSLSIGWSGAECRPDARLRAHDDAESGAVLEPQSCSFFVEGENIRAQQGWLEVSARYTDHEVRVDVTEDDMEDDQHGQRFFVPVTVEFSGTYSIAFYIEEGPPHASMFVDVTGCSTEPPECPSGLEAERHETSVTLRWDAVQGALEYNIYRDEGDGMELRKTEKHPVPITFDNVEPGESYTYRITAVGEQGESSGCPDIEVPGDAEPAQCPPVELEGRALSDGRIHINASGLHAADFDGELELMRSDGGDFEQVASFSVGHQGLVDHDTEVGTTYTYELVLDGQTCSSVEVTAIPVFPTLLAGGAAIGVSMLGYVALRRRR